LTLLTCKVVLDVELWVSPMAAVPLVTVHPVHVKPVSVVQSVFMPLHAYNDPTVVIGLERGNVKIPAAVVVPINVTPSAS